MKTYSEVQVIRWVAWYKDSQIFTSDNIEWNDLPQFGLLAVQLQLSNNTVVNLTGRRVVFKQDKLIGNSDHAADVLRQFCPWAKFGDYVSDQEYRIVNDLVQLEGNRFRGN